jgi:hypothetical protein
MLAVYCMRDVMYLFQTRFKSETLLPGSLMQKYLRRIFLRNGTKGKIKFEILKMCKLGYNCAKQFPASISQYSNFMEGKEFVFVAMYIFLVA